MPKVSIIVPVYNTEKYLHKCLDSLVNQTLEDIEIVIVNDGSKDSSPEIVKEYMDKYPGKFLYASQENSGQAVARNKALDMCTGEYVGFLDSDDAAKEDMFEKLYAKAVSTNSDLVVCDYEYVTNKKNITKHVKTFNDKADMFIDCFVDPWNKLYRASVLKDNMVTFPEGYFYEDTGWFIKSIPYINACEKIDEALVEHYKREGSTMTLLDDKRVQHIFPVLQDILTYYKNNDLFQSYFSELEYFCTKILLCSSMGRISRVQSRQIRKQLISETFEFISANFPNYKENPYYKNRKIGKYVRFASKKNSGLILLGYKCLNAYKEWRE